MKNKWVIVPVEPTIEMQQAWSAHEYWFGAYDAMLRAAPNPPHQTVTAEEARTFQHWAGMDGATAFHLIERHSDGWGDVAQMMSAWLEANKTPNVKLTGLLRRAGIWARLL